MAGGRRSNVERGLICGLENLTFSRADGIALSGFCSGIAVICVTRSRATDTSTNIFWSQSLFGMAITAWPLAKHWELPLGTDWLWLVAIGLVAAAGQLTMTYAYKHTGASQGSLLSLTAPVMSALIGILYFHEPYSAWYVAGSTLIIGACVYMALNPVEQAAQRAAARDSAAG